LNKLTAITDHALPIVQKHWIGFPSGTINLPRCSRPKPAQLDLTGFTEHEPLKDAESLYRIGLVCSEPMYRFLSFWRVYEAVDKAQGEWCGKNTLPVVERIVARFPGHPAFGSFAGKNLVLRFLNSRAYIVMQLPTAAFQGTLFTPVPQPHHSLRSRLQFQ